MPRILLIFLEKAPRLTEGQLKVLADIGVAAGQLAAATMVLPFVVPGLDRTKIPVIALGVLFMVVFWVGSVLLAKRIKK